MKHIESIQPEYAAEELERIVREEGDATASAALSRLLQQWTGCAIPPLATTPESEVEELVPLCLSILRRHWTTPLTALGDGTTPMSLADLMRRLIGDRVQGNEALGIPPANANIPTAVSQLLDRKIGGVPQAPDGLSLIRIFCDSTLSFAELVDDNIWDVASKVLTLTTPQKVVINCKEVRLYQSGYGDGRTNFGFINNFQNLTEVHMPCLEKLTNTYANNSQINILKNCPNLEEWIAPNFKSFNASYIVHNCPKLRKVVFGALTNNFISAYSDYRNNFTNSTANLIHLEFGEGTAVSLNLVWWQPSEETLAKAEFLSNFKTYIAQRLTDKGSGLTLTLSQAVRDAIQQDPEIVSIITSKGWTISPAPSV